MPVKNKSKQTAKPWLQPFIQLNLPTTLHIILIFSQGNINQHTINRELEFALFGWSVTNWRILKSYEEEK